MERQLKRMLLAPVMALGALVGIVFIFVYKFLIGRWLDPIIHKKNQERFTEEIQERISCLFTDHAGQVVPNDREYPRGFDYAVVTVAVDSMLLRFIRGRQDFRVDVCPQSMPGAWWEISTLLKDEDVVNRPGHRAKYYGLRDFGQFFQLNFEIIKEKVAHEGWREQKGWLVPLT
jgi:hypothetical protein